MSAPISQAYIPTVRHGLCMATTTQGIPFAARTVDGRRVHL